MCETGAAQSVGALAAAGGQDYELLPMNIAGLMLPIFMQPQSQEGRNFGIAATGALRRVYEEDDQDASALLALLHRLAEQQKKTEEKGHAQEAWQSAWVSILQLGVARAAVLQEHAQGLRALRRAYQDVYVDDVSQALCNLDLASCKAAAQSLASLCAAHSDFIVTVEPLGAKTVQKLLAPCKN